MKRKENLIITKAQKKKTWTMSKIVKGGFDQALINLGVQIKI